MTRVQYELAHLRFYVQPFPPIHGKFFVLITQPLSYHATVNDAVISPAKRTQLHYLFGSEVGVKSSELGTEIKLAMSIDFRKWLALLRYF